MEAIKILAVDDHKMTVLGYKYILEDTEFDNFEVEMDIETKFELARQKIENSAKREPYDIILLDIQLSEQDDKNLKTGEDLALVARKFVPETKIVFMSTFSDSIRIQTLFKSVSPNGYMVKSEIDEQTLTEMVTTLTRGGSYYTESINKIMAKIITRPFNIDEHDQAILYELSIGTKTKDLHKTIPLSPTAIESRKRKIRNFFGIEGKSDLGLIKEARNRGFL